jgi:hypothetical protein
MTTAEDPTTKIEDIIEAFEAENDDEDDMEIEEEDGPDFPELLYSLLTTDEDESIANVLKGIRDGLEKQNKILFKIMSALANSK